MKSQMWGSSWPVRSENDYLRKREEPCSLWRERENEILWFTDERGSDGTTVARYSYSGRKSTLQERYSRYWRRERRTYVILAVARTTASGESMIHETNERGRTLQRVRRIGRGWSTSGRCTVCCDPVFSAAAAPLRLGLSLSRQSYFYFPFSCGTLIRLATACTFLEFRQGRTFRTVVIFAVWSYSQWNKKAWLIVINFFVYF